MPFEDDVLAVASIARRYANRPGCRFVGACEVAIQFSVLDLRVVLLEPRVVPPIDEFILRALLLDICTLGELADLLGLARSTVHDRLVDLRRSLLIDIIGEDENGKGVVAGLTTRGRDITATFKTQEYVERTVTIAFHGFVRRPMLLDENDLLRASEVERLGLPIVRAIPNRRPRPDEIHLDALSRVIAHQCKRRREGEVPELISVKSIVRGARTMFQPAVMLQYEFDSKLLKTKQFAFVVDGIPDREYEDAFKDCMGPEKHPELVLPAYKKAAELVNETVPPHLKEKCGELDGVDELSERLAVIEESLHSNQTQAENEDRPDTKQRLIKENESLRTAKEELERQLHEIQARRLNVYDCAKLLDETLENVQQRLVIFSAFLGRGGVDKDFLRRLDKALKRGVKVWIGYGMPKDKRALRPGPKEWSRDDAEKSLRELRRMFKKQFKLQDFSNTHEKILLCDEKYVVTGSFNWLSYRPDGKRVEDAVMLTDRKFVEEYFTELVARFDAIDI